MPEPPRTSAALIVMRSANDSAPWSAIRKARTNTGILMTLALLNESSARTPASSPVVRCFTHTPVRAGKRASSASSRRCRPEVARAVCCAAVGTAAARNSAAPRAARAIVVTKPPELNPQRDVTRSVRARQTRVAQDERAHFAIRAALEPNGPAAQRKELILARGNELDVAIGHTPQCAVTQFDGDRLLWIARRIATDVRTQRFRFECDGHDLARCDAAPTVFLEDGGQNFRDEAIARVAVGHDHGALPAVGDMARAPAL